MALYSRAKLIFYKARIWSNKHERYRLVVIAIAILLMLVIGYGRIY